MAKTVFYARVSTRDQNPSLQTDAAKQLGVKSENTFIEKASGSRNDRPVLARALAACEKGDTLACYKLDRIGRSLAHLTKLLADLEARGVHFRTVEDGLDTRGSTGKLVLHMLGAVTQFERDLIIERTRAGLAAARKRGFLVSYATRGHGRLGVSSAEREAPPSLAGPSENHHPRACWHRPRYRPFKQTMLFPQSVSSAGQRACRKQFIDGLLMRPSRRLFCND